MLPFNINNNASQFIGKMSTIGIIYCLHCISTGKKYIGQTKRDLKTRLRYHNYKLKSSKNTKSKLYHQLKETGWEDFIVGIVESCVLDDLNDKEIFYIEKFNSLKDGLNTAPGGGFFPILTGKNHPLHGVGHSDETKLKISLNHYNVSGKNNPMYGKKFSKEHIEKIKLSSKGNPSAKGKLWWNNGKDEIRSKERPSGDYTKGRLPGVNKSRPSECKNTHWWNNGMVEIRSKEYPGKNFIKGRICKPRKPNVK